MPFQIITGDITKMQVDAIVNAAKNTLESGGGVDGAIHRAAGPQLLTACREIGWCDTGSAVITDAYRLPCRFVIHTVGPRWCGGGHGEREALISCYWSALDLARRNGCGSVAFPLISAGHYGYPFEQAKKVAVYTLDSLAADNEMLYLVLYGSFWKRFAARFRRKGPATDLAADYLLYNRITKQPTPRGAEKGMIRDDKK